MVSDWAFFSPGSYLNRYINHHNMIYLGLLYHWLWSRHCRTGGWWSSPRPARSSGSRPGRRGLWSPPPPWCCPWWRGTYSELPSPRAGGSKHLFRLSRNVFYSRQNFVFFNYPDVPHSKVWILIIRLPKEIINFLGLQIPPHFLDSKWVKKPLNNFSLSKELNSEVNWCELNANFP